MRKLLAVDLCEHWNAVDVNGIIAYDTRHPTLHGLSIGEHGTPCPIDQGMEGRVREALTGESHTCGHLCTVRTIPLETLVPVLRAAIALLGDARLPLPFPADNTASQVLGELLKEVLDGD